MGRDVVDLNQDHTTPTNTGQAILVVDLNAFGEPANFKQAVDKLVRDIRGSERMPGYDRIWLPGEQSHGRRAEYASAGIPIAATIVAELDQLADQLKLEKLVCY
jgi:L-2-hydroxycarboxylate dehydrogenase (NAD+)